VPYCDTIVYLCINNPCNLIVYFYMNDPFSGPCCIYRLVHPSGTLSWHLLEINGLLQSLYSLYSAKHIERFAIQLSIKPAAAVWGFVNISLPWNGNIHNLAFFVEIYLALLLTYSGNPWLMLQRPFPFLLSSSIFILRSTLDEILLKRFSFKIYV
jgi:hypothetical protein